MTRLELWGGHECTVNRVRNRFFDQTVRSGHEHRPDDLEMFASLGVTALRYPVLWERTAPRRPDQRDFAWADQRLHAMRRLGVRPIVGLVHHGSGPSYTNLLDDGFAAGLAGHAAAVAERYPWVRDWTPVNEPLTTARFSCLYGYWYPHTRDEAACWTALLNQVDATRLSMREIRRVNPEARLIQTEDLGYCHATPPLAAQAEFENHRRWLTWDLLSGRVTPEHPLWARLAAHGLGDRLRAIADDPCPADVLGVNHYLSSERFLDHRTSRYPRRLRGADGRRPYVNIEAVRTVAEGPLGVEALLAETWSRYGAAMAVTECHNGCTREEQMRWFLEVWRAAERLRSEGAPIEAVTAWSLLGAYDWNALVRTAAGHYECGVFDLRGGAPRATAMAGLLKSLAAGEEPALPAVAGEGWWRRRERFLGAPVEGVCAPAVARRTPPPPRASPRLLITGASGQLGQAFARACEARGLDHVLTSRRQLDLDRPEAVREALQQVRPWAVINAAGWSRVDAAEADPDRCMGVNAAGAEILALACKAVGAPLVGFSSHLVFDGAKAAPYLESDLPRPLNAYGRSKAEAERLVLASGAQAMMVRTSTLFAGRHMRDFATRLLTSLEDGEQPAVACDRFLSPTYAPDLVDAVLDQLIDGELGLRHLANAGRMSWAEFAQGLAVKAGFDADRVRPAPAAEVGWRAPRPVAVALGSEKGQMLPDIHSALDRFGREQRPRRRVAARSRRPDLALAAE